MPPKVFCYNCLPYRCSYIPLKKMFYWLVECLRVDAFGVSRCLSSFAYQNNDTILWTVHIKVITKWSNSDFSVTSIFFKRCYIISDTPIQSVNLFMGRLFYELIYYSANQNLDSRLKSQNIMILLLLFTNVSITSAFLFFILDERPMSAGFAPRWWWMVKWCSRHSFWYICWIKNRHLYFLRWYRSPSYKWWKYLRLVFNVSNKKTILNPDGVVSFERTWVSPWIQPRLSDKSKISVYVHHTIFIVKVLFPADGALKYLIFLFLVHFQWGSC